MYKASRTLTRRSESGLTLLEVVAALAILGVIAVVFLNGMATATKGTFTIDNRDTAQSLARSQMEWVKKAPYNADGYSPLIPSSSDYSNYSSDIASDSLEDGLQKITVTVKRFNEVIITLEGYKTNR